MQEQRPESKIARIALHGLTVTKANGVASDDGISSLNPWDCLATSIDESARLRKLVVAQDHLRRSLFGVQRARG